MPYRQLLLLLAAAITLTLAKCAPSHDHGKGSAEGDVPATLRIDYLHTGAADSESFRLDNLIVEGPWPGPPDRKIDQLRYGPYFFEIRDAASDKPLYSRGYASIFGEWQTTGEAHDTTRTFQETLRVPLMTDPAVLVVYKRDKSLTLREIWRVAIDPNEARPAEENPEEHVWTIMDNGPSADKVDLLMLGDGYTVDEMSKWHSDAQRLTDTLFSYEPFKHRKKDFNVRAIDTPSNVSGIAKPSEDLIHETPIGATYDAFGTERYILTFANKRWRDIAAAAPYEFVIIVVNDGKYGGAGIYNLYSTVAADNEFTPYVLVHEFGHHFAGLGDEYYSSDVAYESDASRPEPWSPNVTASATNPKWKALIDSTTPLPTPWPKAEYEALQAKIQTRRAELRASHAPEEKIAALFMEERRKTDSLFSSARYGHVIGTFEGANYAEKGYYRPEMDCIMFTRDPHGFCRVCLNAVSRMIDQYAGAGTESAGGVSRE